MDEEIEVQNKKFNFLNCRTNIPACHLVAAYSKEAVTTLLLPSTIVCGLGFLSRPTKNSK
jgi:hypothetical protein